MTLPVLSPLPAEAAKARVAKAVPAKLHKAIATRPVAAPPEKDAAIVVDGPTGAVLYARHPDAIRYPASLTKMMTLYLLFDALEQGKLTLASQLNTSTHAASQNPTKLYLQPGQTIPVDTAIKAIAVLSANDVAVVVAEALGGGSELRFASLMTQKAHQLGMTHTNFHNASGLPDTQQLTTARDMALLARHLAYDFPQYFHYFSTPQFSFNGRTYFTHDNLLNRFPGTEGIKTGFTGMSGFNLVTSAIRNNRHVIGVVMGGTTAASRDNEMIRLLSATYRLADEYPTMLTKVDVPWHGGKKPANLYGPAKEDTTLLASVLDSAKTKAPRALPAVPPAAPVVQVAAVIPHEKPALPGILLASSATRSAKPALVLASAADSTNGAAIGRRVVAAAKAAPEKSSIPVPEPVRQVVVASLAGRNTAEVAQGDIGGPSLKALEPAADNAGLAVKHWAIQIGAYASEKLAQAQLAEYARRAVNIIGQAEKMVVPVSSSGKTLYRARFGSFSQSEALSICKRMTAQGQNCFAAKVD